MGRSNHNEDLCDVINDFIFELIKYKNYILSVDDDLAKKKREVLCDTIEFFEMQQNFIVDDLSDFGIDDNSSESKSESDSKKSSTEMSDTDSEYSFSNASTIECKITDKIALVNLELDKIMRDKLYGSVSLCFFKKPFETKYEVIDKKSNVV